MDDRDATRLRLLMLAAGALTVLPGCRSADGTAVPSAATASPAPAPVSSLMEVTISGIGGQMSASAKAVGRAPSTTTPGTGTTTLVGAGIDLQPLAQNSFDVGTAGNGTRYFYVTFRVRNAAACATPGSCPAYAVARRNLTLMAATATDATNATPFTRLLKSDGTAASPDYAARLLPIHGMAYDRVSAPTVQPGLESLQLYSEDELRTFPSAPGASGLLPYGFVVRGAGSTTSRALPAGPANGQYDGQVTIAYKLPLAASPADNPTTLALTLAVVDDTNTRVSQSVEEATATGDRTASARADLLGGIDLVTPGFRLATTNLGDPVGAVRTAGPAGAPTATLFSAPMTPAVVRSAPVALTLLPTDPLRLGFCQPMATPDPSTLTVSGSITGPRTLAAARSVDGPNRNRLVFTPAGGRPFLAGETVSYTLTAAQKTAAGATLGSGFGGVYTVGGLVPSSGQLGAERKYVTGDQPTSIAPGDFDGDGVVDLAIANSLDPTVSVLLGDASDRNNFTFRNAVTYSVRDNAQSVATADLNSDGVLDLAVANAGFGNGSGSVSILLGDTANRGRFARQVEYTTGGAPKSVAIGDFNGDGALDLALANSASDTVSVLLGSTTARGTFGAKVDYATGDSTGPDSDALPRSVVTGDFDGDGVPDLAVTNMIDNTVSVLLGDAANRGRFKAKTDFATANTPVSVAVADFDGDGVLDLAVADANNTDQPNQEKFSVLLGDATNRGRFTTRVDYPTGNTAFSIAVGDVNGDTVPDLAVTSFFDATVSVFLGSRTVRGTFAPGVVYPVGNTGRGRRARSVALGDANGDGLLDLFAVSGGLDDGPNGNSVLSLLLGTKT